MSMITNYKKLLEKIVQLKQFSESSNVEITKIVIIYSIALIVDLLTLMILTPLLEFFFNDSSLKITQKIENFLSIQLTPLILVISLIGLSLSRAILNVYAGYKVAEFVEDIKIRKREIILNALDTLKIEDYQKLESGTILNTLVKELDRVGQIFSVFFSFINGCLTFLSFLYVSIMVSYQVTFFAVFVSIIKFKIVSRLTSSTTSYGEMSTKVNEKIISKIVSLISSLKTLKILGKFEYAKKKIYDSFIQNKFIAEKFVFLKGLASHLDELLNVIILIFLLVISKYYFNTSIAELGVVFFCFNRILRSVSIFQKINITIRSEKFSFVNISNLLHNWKKNKQINGTVKQSFKQYIKFENVSYSINENKIINNINLKLKKNKFYMIYGKSGIGKSIFLDLLVGIRTPNIGKILYDKIDLNDIDKKFLYGRIGYVSSDNNLFGKHIRESIELGAKISKSKFNDLMDNFLINEFSKNPDQIIYDQKNNFSSGQIQRVAMARGFVNAKDILILDEATANLNSKFEDKIFKNINLLKKKLTIVLVTHNKNLSKFADETINFEEINK